MQKVSKQSLAMLALSILLAISIALTFTLANLYDKKTATGEITFSGNVALEMTGTSIGTSGSNYTITIGTVSNEVTPINTALTNSKFKLSGTSQAAFIRVTAVVDLNGNAEGAVALSAVDATANHFTASSLVQTRATKKLDADEEVALSSLYTATYDSSKLVADGNGAIPKITLTFTIEADTKSDFSQVAAA